jgi:HTH-type transcriptional regulator/antitoxin HigA
MEITHIRTEKDYRAALRMLSTLVDQDPSPDSPEGKRLDVLSALI